MIYRSVVLGLLGALVLLQAEEVAVRHHERGHQGRHARAATRLAEPPAPVTVHISRRGAGPDPWPALGLASNELLAIDGVPVRRRCDDARQVYAQLVTRWRAASPGSYLELTLRGGRRMTVLITA